MKILLSAYACEPNKGSEPGVGWNWALALVRRGHQVSVITRKNNQAPIEQALAVLGEPYQSQLHFLYYDTPNWILRIKSIMGVQMYYALWQRGILKVAKEAHKKHQFDVVQHLTFGVWRQPTQLYKLGVPCIFGPVGGGENAPWALVHGMPSMLSIFSEYLRYIVNLISLLNPNLRKCLKKCRLVVAKTQETAVWIKKVGVDSLVSLEIGITPERIKEKTHLATEGQIKCLYAGRLIGWKGVHLAIMAIAQARQQGVNAILTIVGNGPLLNRFKQLVTQLGLIESVTFTGQLKQADLFAKYAENDVLLFPSLHDSSGNVVLESFANSLPVICLRLGGPAVMLDNCCGRAIQAHNVSQEIVITRLADTLTEYANMPEMLEKLREEARKKAEAATWDATVDRVYANFK